MADTPPWLQFRSDPTEEKPAAQGPWMLFRGRAPSEPAPTATSMPEPAPVVDKEKKYAASDVPEEAAMNFFPSLAEELNKIWTSGKHAVQNPVETVDTLARQAITGSPLTSRKGFEGIGWMAKKLGVPAEAVDAAIENLYDPQSQYVKQLTEDYGGVEEFKKTMAEKPAQVLFDLSGLLTGAGAGLKGAASGAIAAGKAPSAAANIAAKVGKVADTAGAYTDPLTLAGKAVEGGANMAAAMAGKSTGVGATPLKEAARTGFVGGEEGANFLRAFNKGVPAEEIVGTAVQGVKNIKDKMMSAYAAQKNDPRFGWVNDPQAVNFAPITQAWKDTVDSLTTKSGMRKVGDTEWNAIQKVGEVVAEWEKNPALRSVDDIDGLKQRIRAIYPDGEQPQLRRVVTKMAGAVGNTLNTVPGYKAAMQRYHTASDHLWEMEKAFATGDKSSMQTAMSKLQSVMRDNASTQYGLRNNLLDDIERQGNVSVRPFLAGSSLSSLEPRGLARAVPSGGVGAGMGAIVGGPVGAMVGAGLGLLGSSPKIMGGAAHGAGRVAGAPAAGYNQMRRFMPQRLQALLPEASAGAPYRAFGRGPRLTAHALSEMAPGEEPEEKAGGYFSRSAR